MMETQTGFQFYILGLIVLLSLIAAIGAWRKPTQLTREDAEDLFTSSHERNTAENQRMHDSLSGLHAESMAAMADMRREIQAALASMQTMLDQATRQSHESIQRNLGDLSTNVTAALSEAKRSQDAGIEKVEGTLQQVRQDVDRASTEVRSSIVELQRQHNEAKAQSAIQLCEALISSLGTLRNTIAAQIADTRTAEFLISGTDAGTNVGNTTGGPAAAPDSPDDVDRVGPESQVAPS